MDALMHLILALFSPPPLLHVFSEALRALGNRFACVTVPYWDWAEDTYVKYSLYIQCSEIFTLIIEKLHTEN